MFAARAARANQKRQRGIVVRLFVVAKDDLVEVTLTLTSRHRAANLRIYRVYNIPIRPTVYRAVIRDFVEKLFARKPFVHDRRPIDGVRSIDDQKVFAKFEFGRVGIFAAVGDALRRFFKFKTPAKLEHVRRLGLFSVSVVEGDD